ncbi:unnamed protein product [Chrysoparadoxa australica]
MVARVRARGGITRRFLCFCLALTWCGSAAMFLPGSSFAGPNTEVDNSGDRVIKGWEAAGVTRIAKNFVRLTPDQPSMKGALWARQPLGVSSFTAILEFRISGSAKKFFGDGLALWFAAPRPAAPPRKRPPNSKGGASDSKEGANQWQLGSFHGYIEGFEGVGIIVDTYINDPDNHRDILVVHQDAGGRSGGSLDGAGSKLKGCDASVRWHEARADFEAAQVRARLRVTVKNARDGKTAISVSVQERPGAAWKQCFNDDLPFKQTWMAEAHVGITASTGELADNHDVLRLDMFETAEEADDFLDSDPASIVDLPEVEVAKVSDQGEDQQEVEGMGNLAARLERMEKLLNVLYVKMGMMEHHLEHELVAVEEFVISSNTMLTKHEASMQNIVEKHDHKLRMLEKKITGSMAIGLEGVDAVARAWKMPFLFILLLVCVAGCGGAHWLRRLQKKHLL